MTDQRLHVLLADDDEDDCLFFKDALDELAVNAHLTTISNGEQLIEWLTTTKEPLPGVLFLDLNMPRKGGFECLTEIKQDVNLRQLPVIILSTSFEQTIANQLYANGAQYCVRKPADFAQLKNVIQQALTLVALGCSAQPTKEKFILDGALKPIL